MQHRQLVRTEDLLGDRHPFQGIRGQVRGLPGGYGGLGGGMGGVLARRGTYDPLGRLADPFLGASLPSNTAALGGVRRNHLANLRPLRPDMLTPYDVLRVNQDPYLGLGRRALNNFPLGSRYGPYGFDGLLPAHQFDPRVLCDGRGCHGGLGRGYDRQCEHERCMYDCSRCSGSLSSFSSSSRDLKTKDILIRGKTYKVRKSFLAEAGKFEADIGKYLEKKSEEKCPSNVVEMLIEFINTESCKGGRSLLDYVTLSVLASNLSVKSAGEHSLNMIKKNEVEYRMDCTELTQICVTVLLSSKVDDKLVEWLKKFLKYDGRYLRLGNSIQYLTVTTRKPELDVACQQLLGLMEKDEEDGLRIL